jgi:hypothetical protein
MAAREKGAVLAADAEAHARGTSDASTRSEHVTALARWCYRHRLVVLVLWVGALLGLGATGTAAGTDYSNVFSLPDTDSKTAYDQMAKAFPERSGDTDTVVWKSDGGSVRDQAVRSRIEPALKDIAALKGVGEVTGPYGGARGQIVRGPPNGADSRSSWAARPSPGSRSRRRACPRRSVSRRPRSSSSWRSARCSRWRCRSSSR